MRRRAIISVGRIVDPRGRALLAGLRADPDPEIRATVAFSTGQLKDPDAVGWLGEQLAGPKTPTAVAFEAARALGKIRTPEARAALATYLAAAPATAAAGSIVGEALLSIGRFPPPGDIAPIVRWTASPDVEVRWRAAWALFRPRDPAAVEPLLRMTADKSPEVRFWAVRGLVAASADAAKVDRAVTSARLRAAVKDPDRRVRTEALRALAGYDDDESFAVLLAALDSPDTWLSVSAAEAMGRFTSRKDVVVPKLVAAVAPAKPLALRITALAPLAALAPDAAKEAATALATETQRRGESGRDADAGAARRPEARDAGRAETAAHAAGAREVTTSIAVSSNDGSSPTTTARRNRAWCSRRRAARSRSSSMPAMRRWGSRIS